MLRGSPRLTPASLAARRANALKSTGPRTARGKAWSSLNALRHGWHARNLRAQIERTGDQEALLLFDWIFTRFFELSDMTTERDWNYHLRLAGRVWCHVSGRSLLPRVRKSPRKGWDVLDRLYRYSERQVCPRSFTLLDYRDVGLRFTNPIPSRRRRVNLAWLPEVEFLSPPPRLPRAKRVRKRKGEVASGVPGSAATASAGERPDSRVSPEAGASEDVVALKLECAAEPASCPTESGGQAWGARLAGLAKRVLTFTGVTSRWAKIEERPESKVSPKVGGSEDVVGNKLECGVESASCPTEWGGPAVRTESRAGMGGAEWAERAKWAPGSAGVTKLRQMLEQRLGEQMRERLCPEEPLDLEALLDLDRPLDGEEWLDWEESLDRDEPLDDERASEDLRACVTRLAEAFAGPFDVGAGGPCSTSSIMVTSIPGRAKMNRKQGSEQ